MPNFMSKKIVFVCSSSAGGAERMTVLYAKILKEHGYDCSFLIVKWSSDKLLITDFISSDFNYSVISAKYAKLLSIQLALQFKLIRPDYIFCSQPGNTKRILRLKCRGWIRSKIVFRDFLMPSNRELDHTDAILKHSDLIIAQTQEMKEEIVKYYFVSPEKVAIVYNPLDKKSIKQGINDTFPFDHKFVNYIAINRIVRQKDLITMIKAFSVVIEKQPMSRLYICGHGSDDCYMNELLDLVSNLKLTQSVFFEGPQSNPYKYLNSADVFLLSSTYEGLPNGMMEAMYLGLPVVVTRSIPYIKQVVQDGVNGYTVEVGDYKEFADSMLKAKDLKIKEKFVDINHSEQLICELFDNL